MSWDSTVKCKLRNNGVNDNPTLSPYFRYSPDQLIIFYNYIEEKEGFNWIELIGRREGAEISMLI